ncbi:hypothetical protein GCM10011519_30910 [Marmoricola endophyticus]|uniref:Uncharacterized protein n=1 Tax=Marmoricola endophyticus TaxID=2040280 RepID=A0A917BQC2_9ACTN|nr:hypothetical protein [Marmoricola endophyticus]GGF54798.1 hypothetical protein GCM10011519_30910 [Marmoricola endophyticus]
MSGTRGIFFEEAHALAAVSRLRRDGYAADLTRDRFAGEDDDEDHPWVVSTDAPDITLELLVEEYDGWLDVPEDTSAPMPPLQLPDSPRRRHRE